MSWEEKFTKANYKRVKAEDIVSYVKEVKPEYLDVLKTSVEEGKSFIEIKKEFIKKYFPDAAPEEKDQNKATMRELLGMPPKKKTKKSKKK